jgi:hypothetical protein
MEVPCTDLHRKPGGPFALHAAWYYFADNEDLRSMLMKSTVVLGIALNWGSSQAHCGDGFLLSKRHVSTDVCWGYQHTTHCHQHGAHTYIIVRYS